MIQADKTLSSVEKSLPFSVEAGFFYGAMDLKKNFADIERV
ncbi:hypothetical protein AtDm6_2459 [Acetobacter tropicalis]|uniref:Uncharacterized protein n=1 Tax=Acetobacter tropicalis TaxID=104102 RepID=A0A095B0D3_9PROT|nr:hypothetical protein AtDm6_2459 [Acetobacter tropicalis]